MKYYQKLTLTGDPLISPETITQLMNEKTQFNVDYPKLSEHVYVTDDIENILSPLLLKQLNHIGVSPVVLINFSEYGRTYQTPLHADITYHNNAWQPLEFGINWELEPGHTEFSWFDPVDESPMIPAAVHHRIEWPRSMINGTRYKNVHNCIKLDSLIFETKTAYLVKTDIPHQITSEIPNEFRQCVSIRFSINDVPTWERALEIFKPYFSI